jgi:hypothetical protein
MSNSLPGDIELASPPETGYPGSGVTWFFSVSLAE